MQQTTLKAELKKKLKEADLDFLRNKNAIVNVGQNV